MVTIDSRSEGVVRLRVSNAEFKRQRELVPGEELVFGRLPRDVGQISDNVLVSRRHGRIRATDDGFTVTSIGTYNGFVVRDHTTPSVLYIPRGTGPVAVPFASASITFDHTVRANLELEVIDSEPADLWRRSWGPENEQNGDIERDRAEREVWPGYGMSSTRFRSLKVKANNQPYTWFWTLVAMSENRLRGDEAGVPTNVELASRLHYDTNIIERHVQAIFEALELNAQSKHRREQAVQIAVERGLVTQAHLRKLRERS